MIEAIGLCKNYGEHVAIKDVSFRVEAGEIAGLLGPNGAGKTTTLKILSCYMPPSSGTARIAGHDILNESLLVRKRIGYLPERPPLYREMTVKSYLDFVADLKGVDRKKKSQMIERSMELCGLTEVGSKVIGTLSKGYQQRVGFAQAIIHDPDVIILDEPTIGLDPNQVIEVRNLIKSFEGKKTILLSSHLIHEVSMICNRVIIINEGKVVYEGKINGRDSKWLEEIFVTSTIRREDVDVDRGVDNI